MGISQSKYELVGGNGSQQDIMGISQSKYELVGRNGSQWEEI